MLFSILIAIDLNNNQVNKKACQKAGFFEILSKCFLVSTAGGSLLLTKFIVIESFQERLLKGWVWQLSHVPLLVRSCRLGLVLLS
tara:strand:- start:51 stop:305 length:255 start_codon:yes stop_codon:yes gene_type:complete